MKGPHIVVHERTQGIMILFLGSTLFLIFSFHAVSETTNKANQLP